MAPVREKDLTNAGVKRKHEEDQSAASAAPAKKNRSQRQKRSHEERKSGAGLEKAQDAQDSAPAGKKKRRSKGAANDAVRGVEPPTPGRRGNWRVEQEEDLDTPEQQLRREESFAASQLANGNEGPASEKSGKKKSKAGRKSDDVAGDQGNAAAPAANEDSATNTKPKKHKRNRRERKEQNAAKAEQGEKAVEVVTEKPLVTKSPARDLSVVAEAPMSPSSNSGWTLSPPTAGRFLDQDPIFVADEAGESFLVAANSREVQLLSLETSLVLRTCPAPAGCSVACFTVDAAKEYLINIAYSDGGVYSWNWLEESSSERQSTLKGSPKAVASGLLIGSDESVTFYVVKEGKRHAVKVEDATLFSTEHALDSIQILKGAVYVVARGPLALAIGMKKRADDSASDYTWIELPLAAKSFCSDARLIPSDSTGKEAAKQTPGLALVVGNKNGQLHLFDDVSSIFKKQGQRSLPDPRILHWHRRAVSTVKFSRDGNYLISGGKETVLVLWQLATGKQQMLPHLTSEIEHIVVSPEGDRYAVQMGDNSIMILSTSELKPVANFAGLQTPTGSSSRQIPVAAATLHPERAHEILLSVPSSQPKSVKDIATRPFLQAYDIHSARHITRQALTRNNVTDFNLSPEGTPVQPPDVGLLAISYDGQWLASVDEWMPPASDMDFIASEGADVEEERQNRREAYFKIWQWDEQQGLWTLSTRMDSPHARLGGKIMGAGKVLALQSDPASNGFVTVGEDSCVKLWRSKRKTRAGVALKGARDTSTETVTWSCKYKVQLPANSERADSPLDVPGTAGPPKACVAYSTDGSLLAVAQSRRDDMEAPLAHFINTSTGQVKTSTSELADQEIVALGFCGRYFVAVCQRSAYIWDLINQSLMYNLTLAQRVEGKDSLPQLAINHDDGTFVIATVAKIKAGMRVEAYDPKAPKCLYEKEFDTGIQALLTGRNTRGYTLLFGDATICSLSPAHSVVRSLPEIEASEAPVSPTMDIEEPTPLQDDVEMDGILPLAREQGQKSTSLAEEEDDRPVVRPEQLAGVFDCEQSFAMPSVRDMLHSVIDLYGRKPHVPVRAEA